MKYLETDNYWSEQIKSCYSKDLATRKNWYSTVAEAYSRVRPNYPPKLISRLVELTQLSSNASILEVGCGPGNATVGFASLGFEIVCLEPSSEACQLARNNCQQYPQVRVINTSLEEWELLFNRFQLVLFANSLHWISPDLAYPKSASALQDNGFLTLFWNLTPQPEYQVYKELEEVYQLYGPSLARYEDKTRQEEIIKGLGQNMANSQLFEDVVSEFVECRVTYNVDDYLALLSTFSPYLQLEESQLKSLLDGLNNAIAKNYQGKIEVSYLSGFNLGRKISQ